MSRRRKRWVKSSNKVSRILAAAWSASCGIVTSVLLDVSVLAKKTRDVSSMGWKRIRATSEPRIEHKVMKTE